MATGYDRRQPTRDTFAFQPVAPSQQQARASGQSQGAQLVGGQSAGEGVPAGPQTNAGPVAAGLGQFVQQVMEPHVKRRQQEEFFKGFTRAQEGVALNEITTSSKGLSKIFGSTAYEQGAQFFTARSKIDEWQQGRMAEMDQLRRMHPDELAKVLATTSQDMMTGDPFADQILQQGLLEAAGPLTATVAKERYVFLQTEAARTYSELGSKAGSALQSIASANARLGATGDAETAALAQQTSAFLGTMVQPAGMDDDTYKRALFGFMSGAMERGDFYAVEALRRAGIDSVFDEDDKLKLENAYERYGNRVLKKAMQEPEMIGRLLKLDTRQKMAEIQGEGGITPIEAASELASINADLKRATGIDDIDVFSAEDIRGAAGDVVGATVAAFKRQQDRQWQLEDRAQQRAWDVEDQEREDAQEVAQVAVLWGNGAVREGLMAGMAAGDFDVLANNDYEAGNFKQIALAYARGGWVSGHTASKMRAKITSSVGQQYTRDFGEAHHEWSSLNAASPSTAKAYYGNLHTTMQRFDQMVRARTSPQIAFARTFGDPAVYSTVRTDPARRAGVKKAAEAALDAAEPWTLGSLGAVWTWAGVGNRGVFGQQNGLNESSRLALLSDVTRIAGATVTAAPGVTDRDSARQGMEELYRSGAGERYGQWYWPNRSTNKTPLSTLLRLKPEEAAHIIDKTIADKLRRSGFRGNNGNVIRIEQDGKPALVVQGTSDDGDFTVTLSFQELQADTGAHVGKQVRGNQPGQRRQWRFTAPGTPTN